jgi:hypothetical protein
VTRLAALFASLLVALLPTSGFASGKVLLRAGTQDPATLDPHRFALPGEVQIVSDLFLGLLTLDAEAKPIAGAAESWTVSPDGLAWEFRLRDGLVWSDGRPLTAADFEWSLRRMLDPATAFPFAARLYAIRNARDVSAGRKPAAELGVQGARPAPAAHRARASRTVLPEVLASYSSPAPRHLVEARPADWFRPGVMVSNGPFLLEEWVPNSHVRLRKNPRFYDAARVSLDAVVHVHPGDAGTALRRFRAGELHVVLVVPPDQLDWARQNLPKELQLSPRLRAGTHRLQRPPSALRRCAGAPRRVDGRGPRGSHQARDPGRRDAVLRSRAAGRIELPAAGPRRLRGHGAGGAPAAGEGTAGRGGAWPGEATAVHAHLRQRRREPPGRRRACVHVAGRGHPRGAEGARTQGAGRRGRARSSTRCASSGSPERRTPCPSSSASSRARGR